MEAEEQTIYLIVGEVGFESLIRAFYERVRTDDFIGRMYPPDDWEGSEKRLRDFLIYRFGGPARYIEERGHPRLRMRHMPFPVDVAARDRWLKYMCEALAECDFPEAVTAYLTKFFSDTADFMRNRSN